MKKMAMRGVAAGLILGLLAACSSDSGTKPAISNVLLGTVKSSVQARMAGPRQKVVVTPQMLAETEEAALQINPEVAGGTAFLRRAVTRRDSALGNTEIWKSSDDAQIFLRNGITVGSRGLGADVISADARLTVQALRSRSGNSGTRSYQVSDGDATLTNLILNCTIQNLGTEKITIVNLVFTTDHMRESCVGGLDGNEAVTNDYWVQRGTGLVRKSRQWMGPRLGYFEIILLKN